jgi:hypothetical protein
LERDAQRPESSILAAERVAARLLHMKQHWEDAASNYFQPAKFQLALQSAITTSRTVSFILQSNKSHFDDFDAWYGGYRERWRDDPVMRWGVEARNTIEKRGDLETHSQVRSTLVASYLGGATTEWVKRDLFKPPIEILIGLPTKYSQVPQIQQHGTLVIERRWVDSELPDREVLDALAHIYGQFVAMLTDLFQRVGGAIPNDVSDPRPIAMQPLIMDRAIYISVQDGSEMGIRLATEPAPPGDRRLLEKRYSKRVKWNRLGAVKDLRQLAELYFENAQSIMLHDGYHRSFLMLFKDLKPIQVIGVDHPNRAMRYVLMREMAAYAKRAGANSVILIAEAWTAEKSDLPPSGYAMEAKKRGEALTLHAADDQGSSYACSATVVRKLTNKRKVRKFVEQTIVEDADQFLLMPFQKEWGCLTAEVVTDRVARLAEMGFDETFDEVSE